MDAKKIVQNYLAIFFGEKFNPNILSPLLTDDFYLKGSMITANDSQELILKLKDFGGEIDMNAEIHQLICEGNTVVAHYDFFICS